jgi:glycosyltransferase involved in cell wall biosynthesis
MDKLNVLLISSWYPSKEHPTLGNFVQKHAEAIQPFVNLKVLYVTSSIHLTKKNKIENKIINGVDTTVVYYKKITSKIPIWSQIKKYKSYIAAYQKGFNYITQKQQLNFDLVHCNITYQSSIFARQLKKEKNIPYIITEHSTVYSPYKNEFKNLSFFHKNIIKKGIKDASVITVVSDFLKQSMLNLGLNNNYKVIANVVNTDIFTPNKTTIEKKDKAVILHISHMDNAQKNGEGMLKVIKTLSTKRNDFIFKIISDDNIDKTKALIEKYKLNEFVILESTKTTALIAQEMKNASFFLLYSNYETFSVVLAEAWCTGLPAVYSKCGGLTEIDNRNLGIQVEANNNLQLEKVIDNMLNTYYQYNPYIISEYAKTKFNSKFIGQQFLTVYDNVLNNM